jgi:hypothetical protein
MLRFVARRFGERALKDVLDALGEESRAVFKSGISKDSWVSFRSVRELMRQVDARLGRDDMYLVLECGRAGAEGAFDLLRDIKPPQPPPELLVSEMPKLGPRVMRGIDFQVKRVGRGYGRLELIEQGEPSLHSCVATLGFMDRSLDRFGAAEVEVTLLSCQALGDESCLMDLSWL